MSSKHKFVLLMLLVVHGKYSCAHVTDVSSPSNALRTFGKCFFQSQLKSCLYKNTMLFIDNAIRDNSTWKMNEFLSIVKNNESTGHVNSEISSRSLDDSLTSKLENLIHSRTLHWKWNGESEVEGTNCKKGRKKHDKHKHKHGGGMLMMSGVAMVAMMTQFVLGKIAFVAGAALIIAKIALYFSTMRQYFRDISVQSPEHVVYADHGHPSINAGWQRSIYPAREELTYEDIGSNKHTKYK